MVILVISCRKAKAVDCMVVDVLLAAEPVLNIKGKIWDPRRFITLDDTILKRIEHYAMDDPHYHNVSDLDDSHIAKAQQIMRRLRNRDLYKYCGEVILDKASIPHG